MMPELVAARSKRGARQRDVHDRSMRCNHSRVCYVPDPELDSGREQRACLAARGGQESWRRAERQRSLAARDGSANTTQRHAGFAGSGSRRLRAAAILAVLSAGVRKNELISLNATDLSDADGVLTLRVRRTRTESRVGERSVQLPPDAATLLRRYWAGERLQSGQHETSDTESHAAPLFWTLGRQGRCRRTRITGHAVNYWLERLRRRMGLEQRLTAHSPTNPYAKGPCYFADPTTSAFRVRRLPDRARYESNPPVGRRRWPNRYDGRNAVRRNPPPASA
jgi:Phage integrase family